MKEDLFAKEEKAEKSLLKKYPFLKEMWNEREKIFVTAYKKEFEQEVRFILALKLYELGKLSSGKSAELAGISRIEFLMKLGYYKVSPFQTDLDEILFGN